MIKIAINNEFQIQRHLNGITLSRPNPWIQNYSLKDLTQLPLQCYFTNLDHEFCYLNPTAVEVNGFDSENDAIGRTVAHTVRRESVQQILRNNQTILHTQSMQIVEESILRKDETFLEGISVKFPWYEENKLIGIFGCSFVIDSLQAYVKALALLTQTGLLSLPSIKVNKEKNYFSKREQDILFLLTRGKTAKQIAESLGLSKRTVEHYLENAKTKTHTNSKSELIEYVFGLFQ